MNLKCGRVLIISGIIIIFLIPSLLFAFQNEPNGFRGIKWGTNIAELPGMEMIYEDNDAKFYHKKNDKMKIGDAELVGIRYRAYKGKFYQVVIKYENLSNFMKIKETLFQVYGAGHQNNQFLEEYGWVGSTVFIHFSYKEILNKGQLSIIFLPIYKEKASDDKEKAKKGAEDL